MSGTVASSPPAEPRAPAGAANERRAAAGATYAVVVLTAMNLLNYLDRYVPSAVKDLFKSDLGLTDAQTSYPLTAFIVVYMITSPIFGSLADRGSRRLLIAAGVVVWSLATGAAALATGFWTFMLARALVGVGEAAYATIAPSLISDFYPKAQRNRVLTFFYVAIPVGAALGFTLGGLLGASFGWRAAFLVCGLPGVLTALLCVGIKEPPRGAFDEEPSGPPPDWGGALRALAANRPYVNAVAGYTAVTFAAGGMADWFPTFLSRHRGMDLAEAGSLVGTITVIGGLGGTVVGGILADKLKGRTRQPYLAVSAASMLLATVFAALTIAVPGKAAVAACMLAAQFFLWFYNGPINAIIANSVQSALVARAFSLSILAIHLLGDAISPPIIGALSDATGNLALAVCVVPLTLAIGCALWGWGWRRLPEHA